MTFYTAQKNYLKTVLDTITFEGVNLGSINAVITNTPAKMDVNPLISITRSNLIFEVVNTEEVQYTANYRIRIFRTYLNNMVNTEDSLEELLSLIVDKLGAGGHMYGNNDKDDIPYETLTPVGASDPRQFSENVFYINLNLSLKYYEPRVKKPT